MFWSIVWAVIWNIFASLDEVFSKKALYISHIPKILFLVLGEFGGLVIACIWIAISSLDTSLLTLQAIWGVLLIVVIVQAYNYIDQTLHRKEKISTLIPYSNLNTIFSIIAGFLIFRDSSLVSLFISIAAFLIIIVFTVDFKRIAFPKRFNLILLVEILMTCEILITWSMLKDLPDKEFFSIYQIFVFFILLFPIIRRKMYASLKRVRLPFYGYVSLSSLAGNFSFLLFLFVVGEFGVVLSILFSFLWTGVSLLCWYLIFKEKPTKKEIIMTIVITVLVWLGFYFK